MSIDLAVVRLVSEEVPQRGNLQRYTMTDDPKTIAGIQQLVQLVTIGLLSAPGSHILDPSFGTGLDDAVRNSSDIEEVRGEAVMAVARLRDQILQRQSSESIADDERLADLRISSVRVEGEAFVVEIDILSAAGTSVTINSREVFL